jgi:hypothetical protein
VEQHPHRREVHLPAAENSASNKAAKGFRI